MVDVDPLCHTELLGGLRVLQGERVVTRFRTQKGGALLAYLAYHLDRPHPREVLIELLWPWSTPAAGRNSLSVELSALRRQLEPPGVPKGAVVEADRTSVRLNAQAVDTDVAGFEGALASADRAGSETDRVQCLMDAVAAYRGPLLPGYYQEWILPEQERLAGLYIAAVHALTTRLKETGEYGRAIEYAHKAVGAERLREEAHRNLIELLAASGQTQTALRQYAELEQILAEEFGAEPSAAVRALAAQLAAARDRPPPSSSRSPLPPGPAPAPERAVLPSGTVALLLADVERLGEPPGGTGQPSEDPVAQVRDLLRGELQRCGGQEVSELDDLLAFVFARPSDAVSCAVACQRALTAKPQAEDCGELRVRMALDTGEAELHAGKYRGTTVERARGLLLAAHGGQILCSEAAAGVLRTELPDDVSLADLGHFRLRTVQEPERIFAAEYTGMRPASFPPPNASFAYRSNLPPQFTRFFGREDELARLRQLLLADGTRLVTLTGPGGSGKTRLAIEAARELSDALHHAVWFVPLQEFSDAGLIAGAVVDALKLERSPGVEPLDQACEALSRQPSLLVLDNLEHVVDDGAPIVQSVLERTNTTRCLVTSRQRLDVSAERELPVGPLPTPADEASPDELVRCPSVQLFVDRAQAVRPDFQITEGNAATIAALCGHLEGIPLALELAAARAQVMTPARMLERVESRFGFLVSRRRDVAERHRTLRAALDWSYELLRVELQRFFARLSVFRGGWVVGAAEAVCDEPRALEYLEQLRECSMILVDQPGDRSEDTRFRMLETLREYGWQRLSSKDGNPLRDRHAQYYLALAQEAEPKLRGREQVSWFERLRAEHDNFRASLSWLAATDAGTADGLALSTALARFWMARGYVSEGRSCLAHFLARAGDSEDTLPRARALVAAGQLATDDGDVAGAPPLLQEALAISERLADPAGMAAALAPLGMIATWASDLPWAESSYTACLSAARQANDGWAIAAALGGLSRVAAHRGQGGAARALGEERLAMERELGDPMQISEALHDVGVGALLQADYPAARAALEECLRIRRDLQYPVGIAQALHELGWAVLESGDIVAARGCFEECHAICTELPFPIGLLLSLWSLGRAAYHEGDLTTAERFVQEAVEAESLVHFFHGLAAILWTAARIAMAEGDLLQARRHLAGALDAAGAVGDQRYQALSNQSLWSFAIVETLAEMLIAEGRPELGVQLISAASARRDEVDTHVPRIDRPAYEQTQQAARRALGKQAFERVWAEGSAMAWEEAFRVAEEELGEGPPEP